MALFASRSDVQTRLGRDLTDAEADQTDLLLELATGAIAEACNTTSALSPVPTMVRVLCIEVVTRVLLNPDGVKSGSESLGAYSHSATYANGGGIELTDREERLARRAVHGRTTGSVPINSIFQETET